MATPATQNAAGAGATSSPNQGPPPTFLLNEHVLCYHGPLVYEAKILKLQNMEEPSQLTGLTGMHYFVHYKGWKRTWDEWVPVNRLLKITDENLQLQKKLQSTHSTSSHAAHGAAASTATKHTKGSGTGAAGGGTNAKADSGTARLTVRKDARGTKRSREEDDNARKPEMKLVVPELLKEKLVDDWERVTKNCLVVPVPREPTVEKILQEFSEYVLKTKPPSLREPNVLLPTIIAGLQCYFDKALGTNLLYRGERLQYSNVRKMYWTGQDVVVGVTEKEMSCIYGAEHLLRMIVSLPGMVAQSALDPESVTLIRDYVNELLQFILRERDRIFIKEYQVAGPAYQNVVRS